MAAYPHCYTISLDPDVPGYGVYLTIYGTKGTTRRYCLDAIRVNDGRYVIDNRFDLGRLQCVGVYCDKPISIETITIEQAGTLERWVTSVSIHQI